MYASGPNAGIISSLPSSRFLDANGPGELGDHFNIFEYRATLIDLPPL